VGTVLLALTVLLNPLGAIRAPLDSTPASVDLQFALPVLLDLLAQPTQSIAPHVFPGSIRKHQDRLLALYV
jgi:hypothetical protein